LPSVYDASIVAAVAGGLDSCCFVMGDENCAGLTIPWVVALACGCWICCLRDAGVVAEVVVTVVVGWNAVMPALNSSSTSSLPYASSCFRI